jgi:hypothetical protein
MKCGIRSRRGECKRREFRITVPDRNAELAVRTTPGIFHIDCRANEEG